MELTRQMQNVDEQIVSFESDIRNDTIAKIWANVRRCPNVSPYS